MLRPLRGKDAADVLVSAERRAKNQKALAMAWERPITCPDGFLAVAAQVGDVCRLLTCCVPDAGCATVELNARMLAKCLLTGVQQFPDALGNCNDINVVEVGKDGLALSQLRVNSCEGWVLRDGVQSGHERVALLAAFRLPYLVRLPVSVLPNVHAVGGIELAHVGEQRLQAGSLPEARKHRVARHMIKCADCVDGQYGCTRVDFGGNAE